VTERAAEPLGAEADVSQEWIQPIKTPRAFEEILGQLESALHNGHLVAGGRLPAERDFAAALGVSRTSVREALRVLEALGLVDVNRGRTGALLRSEPGNAFADILRLHVAFDHYSWASIIEVRGILEAWAFSDAAQRADKRLLAQLSNLLEMMSHPNLGPASFLDLDVAFHSAVVDASGNQLVASILAGCSTLIRKGMFEGITAHSWPDTAERLIADHRQLYEAVRSGEPERASEAVREHIRRWDPRRPDESPAGDPSATEG
jgi:GntR family transcriptional regulator, transcriptional repressor for pyruvate dehydrogenase complex